MFEDDVAANLITVRGRGHALLQKDDRSNSPFWKLSVSFVLGQDMVEEVAPTIAWVVFKQWRDEFFSCFPRVPMHELFVHPITGTKMNIDELKNALSNGLNNAFGHLYGVKEGDVEADERDGNSSYDLPGN